MLRPRASDMTGLAVPGSLAARSADWGRHERKHAAPLRTPATQVTLRARLRPAWRAVPAPQHPQQREAAAAMRAPRQLRQSQGPCPARCWGFPTIAGRMAGRRRGTPPGCRRTPRWRGTAAATPDAPVLCHGGGTSRRSRCRMSRGSTRPGPGSSPPAGPAAPATMPAPGGSGAGERRVHASPGKEAEGRGTGRATPANARMHPDRPDPHRGHRLRPER